MAARRRLGGDRALSPLPPPPIDRGIDPLGLKRANCGRWNTAQTRTFGSPNKAVTAHPHTTSTPACGRCPSANLTRGG